MIHLEWRPYTAADGTAPKTFPVRLWEKTDEIVRKLQLMTIRLFLVSYVTNVHITAKVRLTLTLSKTTLDSIVLTWDF